MGIKRVLQPNFDENVPLYLRAKVILSNQISLAVFFLVAIPIGIICYFYFRSLVILPLGGSIFCAIVIAINLLRAYHISRFVVALLPFTLGYIFNLYVMQPHQQPIASIYICVLSFTLIPFLVFELREKYVLACCTILIVAALLGVDVLNRVFDMPLDSSPLRGGALFNWIAIVGMVFGWTCVWVLSFLNQKAKKKSKKLVVEMEDQFEQLKDSEEKLKNNIQEIEKAKEEERIRNWTNEGINMFSEILRANDDIEVIYRKLISNLVEYIGANQGGLYIVDEKKNGEKEIKLAAGYAYSAARLEEKALEIDQGLLGRAYLEGDTVHLKQINNNYTSISSGMGGAIPSSLLVIPLKVNEFVEAILEVACLLHIPTNFLLIILRVLPLSLWEDNHCLMLQEYHGSKTKLHVGDFPIKSDL